MVEHIGKGRLEARVKLSKADISVLIPSSMCVWAISRQLRLHRRLSPGKLLKNPIATRDTENDCKAQPIGSMAKQFRITEKLHARFESTFTNVLNHTNFASPVTAI